MPTTTYIPKLDAIQSDRKWFLIDAQGLVLGKLAVKAAVLLTGKHKATYTQFLDTGDHVVVINAAQVQLTGRKEDSKLYHRYSGYPGGMKTTSAAERRAKRPERLVEDAVRGMLPKTKLGRAMFLKLKVYAGASHRHQAQKPQPLTVN
jgi:large subunit ribosomal protein L13